MYKAGTWHSHSIKCAARHLGFLSLPELDQVQNCIICAWQQQHVDLNCCLCPPRHPNHVIFQMVWVVYFHIRIPGLHQARFIRPLKRVSLSMFLPQWTLMPGTCLRCIKYLGRAIVDHPRAACHAEPNKVLFHSYDVSRNSYRSDIKKGSPMPRWSRHMKFVNCCDIQVSSYLCSIRDNCF